MEKRLRIPPELKAFKPIWLYLVGLLVAVAAILAVALPLTLRFVALGVEKRLSLPLKVRCRSGLFAVP